MFSGLIHGEKVGTVVIFLPSLTTDEVGEMRAFAHVEVCISFERLLFRWRKPEVVAAVVNCEAPGISQRINELARIHNAQARHVLRIGTMEIEGYGVPSGRNSFIGDLRQLLLCRDAMG